MPVTGLYYINENTQPPAFAVIIDRLTKRHQPSSAIARWTLEHRLLREAAGPPSAPGPTRFMQWLELSQYPAKLFVLAGTSIITIDREFTALVKSKLSSLWQHRQMLKAEGQSFDVDDFKVRIGRLLLGEQYRGVLVEIEYGPCDSLEVGEEVIRDFLMGLDPPQGKFTFAPKEGYQPGRDWTELDTGRQYCELLRFR